MQRLPREEKWTHVTLRFFSPFDTKIQSIHDVNTMTFPLKPLEAWTKTGKWSGQREWPSYDNTEDDSPLSVWTWGSRAALFILDTGDSFFLVQSLIDTVCVCVKVTEKEKG